MKFKKILIYFLSWRILLIFLVYLGIHLFPLQNNFLGGGIKVYLQNPYLWSWANFDGEHYLAIAREGYRPLTYFFFPLYPILIKSFVKILNTSIFSYLLSGLFISNFAFLIGLIGFVKLILLNFNKSIAIWSVIILLLFPTSFYFAGVYSESLFFALSVWSLYFAKKGNWILAGFLGMMSSATRIFGLALLSALFVEYLLQIKSKKISFNFNFIGILIIPFGLVIYCYYLYLTTGDYLAFFHNLSIYGDQRSTKLILFPQVFYRYIFKIIPALSFNYFPIVFTTFLELITGILAFLVTIWMFYKKYYTYAVFSLSIYILSTLSGSFSSFPRYILSIFPLFIMLSLWLSNFNRLAKTLLLSLLLFLLAISLALFCRGYWVA
jgi:Gpi18-like mannosyltransferase